MKKKRKECYICNPIYFELSCPINSEHKITWSEWEKHIWCYDCKKDFKYKQEWYGPVPIQVAKILGIDYRKYNIKTGEIIEIESAK
jgi:hypothetical protein